MGFAFNPFTGNFDQKGSGGGGGGSAFFAGEVATYADLPLDGTAPLDSRWLVRTNSGTWPFSTYKQAGVYVRIATVGASRDNDYRLTDTSFFDVMSDSAFLVYDDGDATKNLKFQLSGITTGTTRTLTVPNANGTIARTEDFAAPPAIGNTTAAAANFTSVGATGTISGAQTTASPPTTTTDARGLQFASLGGNFGSTAAIYGSHPSTAALGIGIANSSAGSITQVAAFTSSGLSVTGGLSATPASGSALTLTGGTVTASAPVISATQTWNDGAETFTGLAATITNTNSAAGSLVARLTVGSTNVFDVDARGFTTLRKVATSVDYVNVFIVRRGTTEVFAVRDDGATAAPAFSCPAGGAGLSSMNADGFAVRSSGSFRISSDTTAFSPDVFLRRDAAGVFAQYNGTNAQESRLYGTFTSSTNYQRMTVKSVKQTLSALSGASATTTGTFIPDGAVVVGVTTRVATLLTGAAGYTIGDGTDADRWGDITGTAVGTTSDNRDWTAGTIECFTAGGNITLTAKTSNFTAGAVEICVFYLAGEAD